MRIQQNSSVSFVRCLHKISSQKQTLPKQYGLLTSPVILFQVFYFPFFKRYYMYMYQCRIGPCSQHILKPWQHIKGPNSKITTHIIVDHSIMWLKLCFIAVLFAVAYGRSPLKGESLENSRVDLSVRTCIALKECLDTLSCWSDITVF